MHIFALTKQFLWEYRNLFNRKNKEITEVLTYYVVEVNKRWQDIWNQNNNISYRDPSLNVQQQIYPWLFLNRKQRTR